MRIGATGIMFGFAVLALSGCSAHWDGFGDDPVDYAAQHPKKNTIETRSQTSIVHLSSLHTKPSDDEDRLRHQLKGISMAAVESVTVGLSKHDLHDEQRKAYISKLMRHVGYDKGAIAFEHSTEMPDNHANIAVTYVIVVPPECPDWSASPVTSYSNTTQGNFHCANEVNLGLMVADPHDLVSGAGDVETSTTRAALAVQNYNNTTSAAAGAAPVSASSGAAGAASAVSAAPSPQ